VLAAVVAASGAAAAIDLRTGRIPNLLTAATAAVGLALAGFGLSGHSMAGALVGAAFGFALMLPGHLLGGTGAGDVKLLAALGTMLGPAGVLMAFLYGAVAGGLLAVGHAVHRRRLGTTVSRTARLVAAPGTVKHEIDGAAPASRFAYGPALAVGAIAAALLTR
jgi:Flp pilus assembly protein protease CpaA